MLHWNWFQNFTLTLSNSYLIVKKFPKIEKYINDIDNGLYWSNDVRTQIGINLRNKVIFHSDNVFYDKWYNCNIICLILISTAGRNKPCIKTFQIATFCTFDKYVFFSLHYLLSLILSIFCGGCFSYVFYLTAFYNHYLAVWWIFKLLI